MVLDINYFRDEKLLKDLRESEKRRCEGNSMVDLVIEADEDWKKAMYSYEQMKRNLNEMSKRVSEYAKKNRATCDLEKDSEFLNLKSQAESRKEGISECLKKIEELTTKRNSLLRLVGNVVSPDLIASKDESMNDVIRSWVPGRYPWETGQGAAGGAAENGCVSPKTTLEGSMGNLNLGVAPNAAPSTNFKGAAPAGDKGEAGNKLNATPTRTQVNESGRECHETKYGGTYYQRICSAIKRPPWKILQHHEILTKLNGLEVGKGVEVAGHRGFFLKGPACLLNLALVQYGLNFLVRRGFHPVHTPYLMRKEVMSECAELNDFDDTLYCIPPNNASGPGPTNSEEEKEFDRNKLFLIATSEQPLAALHRNETYQKKQLPLKYAGISTCFRREAGAHGRDLKGIFRVHQFQKVEQFVVCTPETSVEIHEELLSLSEEFYRSLGLPFRVVAIVAGALNKAAAKKYDLEAWFPGYEGYRELVSCSNCTDYQARNLNTRFYDRNNQDKRFLHMLNGTLVASQRCLCCVLENYQTPEGVIVPKVLIPYMDGREFIPYES